MILFKSNSVRSALLLPLAIALSGLGACATRSSNVQATQQAPQSAPKGEALIANCVRKDKDGTLKNGTIKVYMSGKSKVAGEAIVRVAFDASGTSITFKGSYEGSLQSEVFYWDSIKSDSGKLVAGSSPVLAGRLAKTIRLGVVTTEDNGNYLLKALQFVLPDGQVDPVTNREGEWFLCDDDNSVAEGKTLSDSMP